MQQEKAADRPRAVSFVTGKVAADGRSIVLRVETAGDAPIDLAVATPDVPYLTTLLLMLGDRAVQCADAPPGPVPLHMTPLPLRSLSLAETDEGETLLVLEVGGSTIAVSLPPVIMSEIGRSMLTLSAARTARAS